VDGTALVVMDARTGAIRGMVGGPDYQDDDTGHVNAALRRRAPGSTLKPFAYALAMQRGWLTPDTLLDDRPRAYRDYHPRNMDPRWDGPVSARDALVRSLNLPALQVVDRVGVARFLEQLRDAGLRLPGVRAEDVGAGSVLGGGMECSLLELVGAYAAFANGGLAQTPHGVPGDAKPGRPILDPGVAWWISEMLSGPDRDVELHGSAADVARPRLAFKTGTSHGPRDAWAIGWNGDWVIGVWRGGMRGGIQPGISGLRHAVPLLGEIARGLIPVHEGGWLAKPNHVVLDQGREWLAGITDPQGERETEAGFRLVSPAPGLEWQRIGGDPAAIALQCLGASGEVHWFHNGAWIGAWPGGERRVLTFGEGQHDIRAVALGGESAQARFRVQ
jgi:penicillin-binding protein 1C